MSLKNGEQEGKTVFLGGWYQWEGLGTRKRYRRISYGGSITDPCMQMEK
jgi:3-deoxy-D-arabino-heptulosonate 7-phosphate (DAHP) synthase